jgi:DNA-binding transcriptional LysR family regulator
MSITAMNIASIDANLLLVLHLVLQEGSATRAARRLHLSQSAVSNALARLRTRLEDPLVVRTGRGLAPTPRAERMAPLLSAAFADLERALGRESFDPLTCTRTFTFADSEEFSQLPQLARIFEERLPRATLDLVVSEDPLAALSAGRADVVLGPQGIRGPGLYRRVLYQERAARVVRRGHPASRRAARRTPDLPQIAVEVTDLTRARIPRPGAAWRSACPPSSPLRWPRARPTWSPLSRSGSHGRSLRCSGCASWTWALDRGPWSSTGTPGLITTRR